MELDKGLGQDASIDLPARGLCGGSDKIVMEDHGALWVRRHQRLESGESSWTRKSFKMLALR